MSSSVVFAISWRRWPTNSPKLKDKVFLMAALVRIDYRVHDKSREA